jgi:Leucine rich repeat
MKLLIVLAALVAASNAVTIGCSFGFTNSLYTCRAIAISTTGNTLTSVVGNHLGDRNNSHVQFVDFSGNFHLQFIPLGLAEFFPNIITLEFYNCSINALSGSELQGLDQLENFSVWTNRIERIPGNMFASNPKLSILDFDRNLLKHVAPEAAIGMVNLREASFHLNICVNSGANTDTGVFRLIQHLISNCTDIAVEPSTTMSVPTTTLPVASSTTVNPDCPAGNEGQRICNLERENQELRWVNDDQDQRIQELNDKVEELRLIVLELTSRPCTSC